jgi:hypothetical protein
MPSWSILRAPISLTLSPILSIVGCADCHPIQRLGEGDLRRGDLAPLAFQFPLTAETVQAISTWPGVNRPSASRASGESLIDGTNRRQMRVDSTSHRSGHGITLAQGSC